MAHQILSVSLLPQPSKTGWAWGVTANNIRVPQPFMGFYWNMPDDAPCIFSAGDQGKQKRRFQRGSVPPRPVIAWDGYRLRAAAATLRAKHGTKVQTVTRPTKWEDLYKWFDAYDIWWMGAWNLWQLLHLVCDENEDRPTPFARFGWQRSTVFDEVADWAYRWCTHRSNRLKLRSCDPRGDILDVLGSEDRENIHGCGAKALDVLRGALHYWRQQYKPPAPRRDSQPFGAEWTQAATVTCSSLLPQADDNLRLEPRPGSSPPQGHARRRSASLPDFSPPSYLKANPAIVIANGTDPVRRELSMPGLSVKFHAAQHGTGEHAFRVHHQASKSGPAPTVPTNHLMTARGVGVENSGPSRLPSRLMQPPPLVNGFSHHQEQPQFAHPPPTANFYAPQRTRSNGSFGVRDTQNRSSCRNEGPGLPWSTHKREAFVACLCQRCMRMSRSVYVAPIDKMDGVGGENIRDFLIRHFGRWGYVEDLEVKLSKAEFWYATIRYASEASARQAVAAARNGQAANTLLPRARIRHPYFSKYYVREYRSPSRDNRSSWFSNKGNFQEGQSWPDQRYQQRSGDLSAMHTTPVRPQRIPSPSAPGNAPSPSVVQPGQGRDIIQYPHGYPGPTPYKHTAWAGPYPSPSGPGHLQNPSPTPHGPPRPGQCGSLSQNNWPNVPMLPSGMPPCSHQSQHPAFYPCGREPNMAVNGSYAQGSHCQPHAPNPCPPQVHNSSTAPTHFFGGPNSDASMQTKPAFEEGTFSEERSSTKSSADPLRSAAGNGNIRVRLPTMLPGISQATPVPGKERETQCDAKADEGHVAVPDPNGVKGDSALRRITFGDFNSPLPPSGSTHLAAPRPPADTHKDNGNPTSAGVSEVQGHANDTAFDWQINPSSRLNTGDIRLDPDYSATVRHRPQARQRGPWWMGNCPANTGSWDGNQATYSAIPCHDSGNWTPGGPHHGRFNYQPQPVPQAASQHQPAEAGVLTQTGHRKKNKFKSKHKTSQGTNSQAQSRTSTPVPPAGSDETAREQPGPDKRSQSTHLNGKNTKGKGKTKARPKTPLPSSSGSPQLGDSTTQNGGSSAPNPHRAQGQEDSVGATSPKKRNTKAKDKASDKLSVHDQVQRIEDREKAGGAGNNKSGYRADAGGSLRIPRKRWGKETTRVDVRDLFGVREQE